MNNEIAINQRIYSIDILRGFVIVLMLLDHVRETVFLHFQVIDPMDIANTDSALVVSRLLAHICAPVFIFLTGLSAYLYMQKVNSKNSTAWFLFTRGVFLIFLELTFVNFAWTFQFPPQIIYLQVIWAIGFSMIALSILIYLPKKALFILAVTIIFGHNMLDSIEFTKDSLFYTPWAILHDRNFIELFGIKARTSYPVLPWFGVIALGYLAGEFFKKGVDFKTREKFFVKSSIFMLIAFFVIRFINIYGDSPYINYDNFTYTVLSFFNITKYPPSLLFLLLTLGIGSYLLIFFEKYQNKKVSLWLRNFGLAPMFFYIFHLYVLKIIYITCVAIFGTNQGKYFGVDYVWQMWLITILLAVVLYFPTKMFADFKQRRRDIKWLKYL